MFVLLINDSNSSGHILSKPGPSISENGPSIFEKCRDPRKTANFGGKKLFLVSEKNFPVRKWVCHVLFAKKMEKFRQIWPQQPLKHFTAAYRGLPPCTQSQHPINRETGYSNVLGLVSLRMELLFLVLYSLSWWNILFFSLSSASLMLASIRISSASFSNHSLISSCTDLYCSSSWNWPLGEASKQKKLGFFTFSQKIQTPPPPPPFLTTSFFSDKDFLDWARPHMFKN